MRMHKKGHLEERLSVCSDVLKISDLTDKNMSTSINIKEYLDLFGIFKNNNPVHLEIGCGKGRFVNEMAKANPEINFIACEKISNVLIEACERAKEEKLKNVYFLNCAAEVLTKYLKPHGIDKIYLNFSNPLPKEGYKKQRLTHPKFLKIYSELLKEGGEVVQKTDDYDFYLFSLDSFKEEGYEILSICEDLASNPVAGDIETEHEKMFKAQGRKIKRIVARVNKC